MMGGESCRVKYVELWPSAFASAESTKNGATTAGALDPVGGLLCRARVRVYISYYL